MERVQHRLMVMMVMDQNFCRGYYLIEKEEKEGMYVWVLYERKEKRKYKKFCLLIFM